MKASLFIVAIVISANTVVLARQTPADKPAILYDPSFWRDELKLNGHQYKRMQDINKEFYEGLIHAFKVMKDDRKAFLPVYAQYCTNRNMQLWQTMNSRQKKKWKKIAVTEQVKDGGRATSF